MSDAGSPSKPDRVVIPDASVPYLSLLEAAEFARCRTRTIQRWFAAGKLTRHGHGRRPLIQRQELADLLSPTPTQASTNIAATTVEADE